MWSFLKKLQQAAKGATAVEYGLLLALIAIIIMGSVSLLGQNANQTLDGTAQALSSSGSDRGSGGGGGNGGGGGPDPSGGSGGGCTRR